MKMISIKVKEEPFQVFYWLHISIQWWPGVAEKMNLNILVLVISIETDDSGKDADTKSTIFWWLMLLSTAENTTKKLTLGLTRKSQIHTPTVVQVGAGGGRAVDGIPPRSFWYVAVFWNDFTSSGKPLIFLTRWGIF